MKKLGLILVMLLIAIFAISAYEMEPPMIAAEAISVTEMEMSEALFIDSPAFLYSEIMIENSYNMWSAHTIQPGIIINRSPENGSNLSLNDAGGLAVRLKFPLSHV